MPVESLPRRATAGLCAMVSWCFMAPAGSSMGETNELYMTRQQQAERRKVPWFLGGDTTPAAHPATIATTLDEMSNDSTAIGPANQPPPRWIKDDAIENCTQCNETFDVFVRKHHCRACGLVFCKNCTSQTERVVRYGFPDPVRVCLTCSIQSRMENEFYERHLPLLERGAIFTKYGLLRKRLVEFRFVRSMLIFQYQTVDTETRAPQGEIKAFALDMITDVKEVGVDKENGLVGLIILVGTSDEHRLDATSTQQRQQWIAAIQSVRAVRAALLAKERAKRAKMDEMETASMRKLTEHVQLREERKQSFHQERLRKRAEQRDSLRAKYNLTATTAAS